MTDTPRESQYSDYILAHYRREAEAHGADASSTMRDQTTRGREIASVQRVLEHLSGQGAAIQDTLDIGCGNGYLLSVLRKKWPSVALTGLEYTPEMVALARAREVKDCALVQGDVRKIPFKDRSWDVVITERCIINVMDRDDQATSLREVARVLRPGGHFLCVEAFTDGLTDLNAARAELGLEPVPMAHHNMWFDKDWFLSTIAPDFEVVDFAATGDATLPSPNFLSSHYFISRALYPAITKREVLYNTHLVKFFSFLPPMGNYSPIQFYVLKKK